MPPRAREYHGSNDFTERLNLLINSETLVSFDEMCGLGKGYTHQIMRGKRPSFEKLQLIVTGTGCNGHWLLTGEGEPFPNDTAANKKSPPHHAGGLGNTSDLQSTPDQTDAVVAFAQCSLALAAALQATKAGTLPLPLFLRLMDDVVQAFGSIPQGLLPAVDALPLPSRRKA